MPTWMIELLTPIASVIGLALATFITAWIRKLAQKANIEIAATEQQVLDTAVKDSIAFVFQTYTQATKEKAEDGKLTPEEAAEAMKLAISTVKERAKAVGIKQLGALLNDDAALKKLIESKLPAIKDLIGA